MKLTMSPSEAKKLLKGIPSATCQKGLAKYWHVLPTGDVKEQSICWLACWAWTGMNSETARVESERVLEAIFPFSFSKFKSRVPHAVARRYRYLSKYDGPDLEGLRHNA